MFRRQLLGWMGAASLSVALPVRAFGSGSADQARLVIVVLRGAWDGLSVLPPVADPAYAKQRPSLALSKNDLFMLNADFGLHPRLKTLHNWWQKKQLVALHAVATPYRERSHFDGQDVLENGAVMASAARDGWLNRALQSRGSAAPSAVALASAVPLILQGTYRSENWAPERLPDMQSGLLDRLRDLYAGDAQFSGLLAQALQTEQMANGMQNNTRDAVSTLANAAGKFLAKDGAHRVAVLEMGGWDTHANQGQTDGALANRLAELDRGLTALHAALGDVWANTAVLMVSEFGRTVRVNGTRGTDHGTATAAFLAGGAVQGGRMICDWPGLADAQLHEGRDLSPTLDLRRLFKAVLQDHLQIPRSQLDKNVFPDSAAVAPLQDLFA